jgi:membrane-associated phospholipid phosphatase
MDALINIFLPVSIWFQNSPGWFVALFKGITFLGDTEFYLIIMPALFWCIDATLGIRTGILLLVSGGLNNILKFAFGWPRPFWVDPKVRPFTDASGFGFPSGHSQNAASIWGLLGTSVPRKWFRGFVLLIIFLIGLSRIVLGVHFTHDVLVGWLVGGILLWLFLKLEKPVVAWFKDKSLGIQILALVIVTSLFLIAAVLIAPPFNPPVVPEDWIKVAGKGLEPYNYDGLLTTTGAFLGLGLGVLVLFQTGNFSAKGPFWQRVLRYLVGLIGVLALYLGLDAIFPDNVDLISYSLRFLRYFLIGLWISFGAPKLFTWLNLAEKQQP